MNKEQQDCSWACLPKEVREEIRKRYRKSVNMGLRISLCELFGEDNIVSDTEPKEMLMVERKKVQEEWKNIAERSYAAFGLAPLQCLFGDKCLPDTTNTPNSGELKSQSADGQLKLNIGDKVIVLGGLAYKDKEGKSAFVTGLPKGNSNQFIVTFEDGVWAELPEKYLEPYTEPQSRNLSQETANCDKAPRNILSDEELENIIFELIRIRDNRRENDRQLMDVLAKSHDQSAK